jgi:SSS family solute:Na+ symporter
VYRKLNPSASEQNLVRVGRVSTVILVVAGLAWIPFMKYISPQLYIYLQSVQAYIAPPIAACFLFGVLSDRLTGTGAITTLLTGFVLGALRLGLELGRAHLAPGSIWMWLATINFLHFAALLFVLSTVLLVAVSLATPAPAKEKVADLTIQTQAVSPAASEPPRQRRVNLAGSAVLAAVIGVLWIVFR